MNKVQRMWIAWRNGIKNPYLVMKVCDEVGLPFAAACAMLEKESYGGENVFGHDPTIFIGAGKVTKRRYLEYKKQRNALFGRRRMQGVGPCQLTWWQFQDQADALGGCWKPINNMRVGLRLLKQYREKGDWEYAGTRYNGSPEYGRDFAARVKKWQERFSD